MLKLELNFKSQEFLSFGLEKKKNNLYILIVFILHY